MPLGLRRTYGFLNGRHKAYSLFITRHIKLVVDNFSVIKYLRINEALQVKRSNCKSILTTSYGGFKLYLSDDDFM